MSFSMCEAVTIRQPLPSCPRSTSLATMISAIVVLLASAWVERSGHQHRVPRFGASPTDSEVNYERVRPVTGGSSTGPSRTALYTKPAIAAPTTGANQNNQSC
jgi:hypothetical protein